MHISTCINCKVLISLAPSKQKQIYLNINRTVLKENHPNRECFTIHQVLNTVQEFLLKSFIFRLLVYKLLPNLMRIFEL